MVRTKRIEDDNYPTPPDLLRTLLSIYPEIIEDYDTKENAVIDPCAGENWLSKVIGNSVLTADIREETKVFGNEIFDATLPWDWYNLAEKYLRGSEKKWQWGITNLPFSLSHEIIPLASDWCNHIAFLLPITWEEPVKHREEILNQLEPYSHSRIIFNPRPRFHRLTKNSDSKTVGWYIYDLKGNLKPRKQKTFYVRNWGNTRVDWPKYDEWCRQHYGNNWMPPGLDEQKISRQCVIPELEDL